LLKPKILKILGLDLVESVELRKK